LSYQILKPGLGNVGNYQVSSIPFLTSSLSAPANSGTPLRISFPSVTKTVTIKNETPTANAAKTLRFGVSENGVKGTNYIKLNNGESFSADIKVTDVFLISDDGSTVEASVYAGLTGIENEHLPNNWSGSLGVG
jgi:hypothetical protein